MTAAKDQNEPFWKGIVSWQAGFAALMLVGFLYTIVNPDKVPSVAPSQTDRVPQDLNLLTESVLDEVRNKTPMKLLAEGKNDEALVSADKHLKARPWDVKTLMAVGDVYCETPKGDKVKGLVLLKKSVAMCPQSRYIRLNYARHLTQSNKVDEAVAQYELLDKSASEEWTSARIELANLYLSKNETAKAVEMLKKVTQNDTKDGAAEELLGLAMTRNGDPKEGFEEFAKGYALRKMQNQLSDLDAYVSGFHKSKSQAETALTSEVKDDPENQNKVILLLELLISENKIKTAKTLLETN